MSKPTTTTAPSASSPAPNPDEVIRLWPAPGKAPLAAGDDPADIPTISIYRPKEIKPDGSSIVVCPGGAYQHLALHEGEPVARWLNSFGVTAFVLTYRLGPRYRFPAAFADVSRAIRTIRHRARARAREWKLDEKKVGVLGFSAGGHLASTVSTHFDADPPEIRPPDEVNELSSRPDVSILCYPVITLEGPSAHVGSRKALLGDNPRPELLDELSNDRHVTAHTPPAFLFHTVADTGVPCENSILYAMGLRKAGVPFEMHLFEPGNHGVGLASGPTGHPAPAALAVWPSLCKTWLNGKGFGKPSA